MRIASLLRFCVPLATALALHGAQAQATYPERAVKMVVPQTAGGPSDVLGRTFAQKLTDALGKPVVVENKPGASGNIGSDIVAKSHNDGHTLLVNILGILAMNQTLYKTMPFDAVRDLDGIGRIANSQIVLVAHPSFAPNTIQELVAHARAHPAGTVSYGSAGTGSPQHIGGELLNAKAGIQLTHVPYKGAVPALQDALGGQIPLAIVGLPAALPYMKAGKLKGIAVFGHTRSALAPEVPTFVESGYPSIELELAYGIFAAKNTPRPIVVRLNQEIAAILKQPEVRERLVAAGFEISGGTPEELDTRLKSEVERWRPIVRESHAVAE
jgi:tripartite-type tricarboxylate transporter receptor subunit TctC